MLISYLSAESVENSSKMEYKKKAPTMEVCPRIRKVSTVEPDQTSPRSPTTADALLEDSQNRVCGEYPAKEMATEEVPYKVRQANAARLQAHSKMESTEKKLREWRMDDHEPRSIVTEQSLHPVITVKRTPNHAEQGGNTDPPSAWGCGRGRSCLRKGPTESTK